MLICANMLPKCINNPSWKSVVLDTVSFSIGLLLKCYQDPKSLGKWNYCKGTLHFYSGVDVISISVLVYILKYNMILWTISGVCATSDYYINERTRPGKYSLFSA